jgi:hypothetical protein
MTVLPAEPVERYPNEDAVAEFPEVARVVVNTGIIDPDPAPRWQAPAVMRRKSRILIATVLTLPLLPQPIPARF